MRLYEKIKRLRKERGLKRIDLYNRIKELHGDKALTYNSLERIENGRSDGRVSSLRQICSGLKVTFRELLEGTDEETPWMVFKRGSFEGRYTYDSERAYSNILTDSQTEFLALELILSPNSQTKIEKDPENGEKFKKWVYVLKGKLACTVKDRTTMLRRGDAIVFNSTQPHSFENRTSKETRCIIIQNPRHI